MIQPQINSLSVASQFNHALRLLEKNPQSYGSNNQLLYFLDYGLLAHCVGRRDVSIHAFEKAKKIYDQLYTVSLSKEGATWLVNDYRAPYRGEDFERVMINIFQALNFATIGKFDEALVDARDVDLKLSLINSQYKLDQRNVYKEDAFARFLMGILYEAKGSVADLNDARISYMKAIETYENDYSENYGLDVPEILKENSLAVTQALGSSDFNELKNKFSDVDYPSLSEKSEKAEVYLIHYYGLAPIKHQVAIPIPLPGGYISKLAFPVFDARETDQPDVGFKAISLDEKVTESIPQLGEDIGAIAIENLRNRRVRVIAKAILRSGGKYVLEQLAEQTLEKKYGNEPATWFRYVANLYNITSEQADLRSWQTLPDKIYISRLLLEPGEYRLSFGDESLGDVKLSKGIKKFYIVRTIR